MISRLAFVLTAAIGIKSIPMAPEDFSHLDKMDRVVWRGAKMSKLDPYHMWATFGTESNFNGKALNKRTKAKGCGQLMPDTIKTLGLTSKEAEDCRENMLASIRWMEKGVKEIGTDDPFKLSQWYYCGANYYGKVIFDQDLGWRELCGLTYARKVIAKKKELESKRIFAKHERSENENS